MTMPTFHYKAKKGPHQVVEGEIEAGDEDQVIRQLDQLGLIPVKIQPKEGGVKSAAARSLSARVKRGDLLLFARNLANLLNGSIPILKSLSLLERQSRGYMKTVVGDLRDSIREGLSLSQAMEKHKKIFSPLWINMVRGGESGGVLGEMIEKLSIHQEKEEEIRKKVRGALAYPIFMIFMGAITVGVLLTYFMPRLLGVYMQNKQALPWPTALVLAVSHFLSDYWYWVLGVLILTVAFMQRLSSFSSRRLWLDSLKLRIPFIKQLVLKNAVMQFSRTLWLLLERGVPLVKGVPLAAATMENQVIGETFKQVEVDIVTKGSTLAAALRKIPYFPPMAVDMVAVGEESGHLARSLSHIAVTYEQEVEGVLRTLTTLLEPLLILLIGSIIGFIAFAMLLPVFDIDVMM